MNETLFIINPASARGATLRAWSEVRNDLTAAGLRFDECVTAHAGEATEIARQALKSGATAIIAVGGDGTLGEVVNGYFDEAGRAINSDASLGLLPSGTGSDFRRSAGLMSRSQSVRALIDREARLIDVVHASFTSLEGGSASRFFINTASFGFGGDVSALVNRWRSTLPRWIGGRARFAAAAVATLRRYRNLVVSMRLDGREVQANSNLVVVGNGKFAGGGMMLAPNAEIDDGLLDVIVTDNVSRLDVIKELPRIQRGAHLKNTKVSEMRARVFSIESEIPMALDLDGESSGFTPAELRVVPLGVRFLTNRK